MDQHTAETGARRLLAELKDHLAGPGRPLVPHGFEVQNVMAVQRDNVFAPDLEELAGNEITIKLQVPVIWEPEGIPARASGAPATQNLQELRELIELRLRTGEYWELRAGALARWEAVLPNDAPKPSNIDWSVTITICSH
jgi:hypothetical protein